MKVVAIIVTYNRKNLLLHCIDAIYAQCKKPDAIYIIDNNSTDGTYVLLHEKGIVNGNNEYNGISLIYVQLPINGGGSMGFHEGLKRVHNEGVYDYYWVMDDDGEPHPNCLKELLDHLTMGEYLSPLVVDIENKTSMAFGDGEPIETFVSKRSVDGEVIVGIANPFNGILYSKRFLEEVGYPERDMFIWGDEVNYDLRARQKGFAPTVICKAMHFHPKNRASHSKPFFFGMKKVIFVDNKWKMYCRCCNAIHNYKLAGSYIQIIKEFCLYNWLFLFTNFRLDWVVLYNKAFFNGMRSRFGGHKKYMR